MLIMEGIVTRREKETYKDKAGKEQETIRFAVEGAGLVPDRSLSLEDLPPVGEAVRAVVNRIYLADKKRDLWLVLGFQQTAATA